MKANASANQTLRVSAPRRMHFVLAALAFSLFAIYGSLVPLDYRPVALESAITRFREILRGPAGSSSRSDWAANFLLFIPISYCWIGALLVDGKSWPRVVLVIPLALAGCLALSSAIEFSQVWFPPRVPSKADIVAQTIGTLAGAAAWLVTGSRLTALLRSLAGASRDEPGARWFLYLYLLGLLLYSLLPLDLTIQPQELYEKFRSGRVEPIPFGQPHPLSRAALWEMATNALLFVPVGAWAALAWTKRNAGPRPVWASVLIGAGVAIGIEGMQLFVASRFSSATQVVTATIGVLAGAWLTRRFSARAVAGQPARDQGLAARLFWSGAVLFYAATLCLVFWWPMDLLRDGRQVRERLHHFVSVPFASSHTGSILNAATDNLRKLLLFGILGLLWMELIRSLRLSPVGRAVAATCAVVFCAALATGIELGQAAFPPHVSDISDVLVATGGAVLAMWGMSRIRRPE